MTDCIFCKLAQGGIPTDVVYEDDKVFAFKDMDPKAPHHYLFIPKTHISSLNEWDGSDVITAIYQAMQKVAKEKGFADSGYRIVMNCGKDGGQTVFHLHFHLLAGREFTWPAG